jgi:hypothetical protein
MRCKFCLEGFHSVDTKKLCQKNSVDGTGCELKKRGWILMLCAFLGRWKSLKTEAVHVA